MITPAIVRRFVALLTAAFFVGSAFASPLAEPRIPQAATTDFSRLVKKRLDGCGASAPVLDIKASETSELVAARTSSPMCTYLENCCSGNTDNAAKCCDGLRKRC